LPALKHHNVIVLSAQDDEITGPLMVASIRLVDAGAAVGAGDVCVLTESSSGDITHIVWRSVAAGAFYVESDSNGSRGWYFPEGVRVETLENMQVFLYQV
jgi:hypothetical protein